MQGCRRLKVLVGVTLTVWAIGCASSGREQASKSGPSPSFGLTYVPQQSEPPVESTADSGQSATGKIASGTPQSRAVKTANLDSPDDDLAGSKGHKLINWMANRDKEAPRKPLPLASSAPVASDDEQ